MPSHAHVLQPLTEIPVAHQSQKDPPPAQNTMKKFTLMQYYVFKFH